MILQQLRWLQTLRLQRLRRRRIWLQLPMISPMLWQRLRPTRLLPVLRLQQLPVLRVPLLRLPLVMLLRRLLFLLRWLPFLLRPLLLVVLAFFC